MSTVILLLILSFLASAVFAETVCQTDWSGGPCQATIQGNWNEAFLSAAGCDWFSTSGKLLTGATRSDTCFLISDAQGFLDLCPVDFDFDGDMDVLAINLIDQSVHWFEQAGENTWIDGIIEELDITFEDMSSITCADLDANGEMDIILGTSGATECYIWFIHQYGSVFFADCMYSEYPVNSIRAFDMSSDGDMDLMLIWEKSWFWELCMMENDGSGFNWVVESIDTHQRDFAFADLDGNGYPDVITARRWVGLSWYSPIICHEISSTNGAWAVAGGDFDCDGDMDVAGDWSSEGHWFQNTNGTGVEWVEKDFNNYPSSTNEPELASGDFDFDGDDDLARWNGQSVSLIWNEDYRGGDWSVQCLFPTSSGSGDVFATDMNSDGILDVLSCRSEGQIAWWQTAERTACGELTSSVLGLLDEPQWESISWDSCEPVGTSISFLVRASDDPCDLGDWSDTLSASGSSLQGILADGSSYLQYKVILETGTPETVPELHEVRFDYTSMGIGGSPPLRNMTAVASNPSFSTAVISVQLRKGSTVSLEILDVTGRTISASTSCYLSSGNHVFSVEDLPSGLYIFRCSAGLEECSGTFVSISVH